MAKKPPVMKYSDLVNLGVQIAKQQGHAPAPVGGNYNAPVGSSGGVYQANGQFYNPEEPMTQDRAEKILAKRKMKLADLDEKTMSTLKGLKSADAQAAFLGQARKKKISWWQHGLDYIGRPFNAVANATNEFSKEADAQAQEGTNSGRIHHGWKGLLDLVNGGMDWGAAFKAGAKGAGEGITGKKHITSSDMIQRYANEEQAQKEGKSVRDFNEGKVALDYTPHINPWLKYGAGFGADVLIDPLTYTGAGLITKGAKGAEAINQLEKTGQLFRKLQDAGELSDDVIAKVLQVNKAPVENLSKRQIGKLSDDAYEVAQKALAYQKEIGKKAVRTKLRSAAGEGTAALGEEITLAGKAASVSPKIILKTAAAEGKASATGFNLGKGAFEGVLSAGIKSGATAGRKTTVGKLLAELEGANVLTKEERVQQALAGLNKKYPKLAATPGINPEKYLADVKEAINAAKEPATKSSAFKGITETALGNAAGDAKKIAALRVGKKYIPLPGVAPVGRTVPKAIRAIPGGEWGMDKFTQAFRAKAGISPALQLYRNQAVNGTGQDLVAYGRNLFNMYKDVTPEVRRGLMQSLRNGATEGHALMLGKDLTTGATHNAAKHAMAEFKKFSTIVDDLHITPDELNDFLPKNMRANAIVKASGKGGLHFVDAAQKDWLLKHLGTSAKIDDPVKAIYHMQSAISNIIAKKTMYETFGREFGQSIKTVVSKGGKESQILSESNKALKRQGYREANVPGLKNILFHPDIAHGLERMEDVFKSRATIDGFEREFTRATSGVKSLMTIYNPGFTPRTFMGEVLLTYLGGVPMTKLAPSYSKASRVMMGRNREIFGDGGEALSKGLNKQQIQTSNILRNPGAHSTQAAADYAAKNGAKAVLRTKFGNMSADEVWHAYLNSGVKSGFASHDLVRGADSAATNAALAKSKIGSFTNKVHNVAEVNEDVGRLAHFIYLLQTGKAATKDELIREAAGNVLKYHLDYSAVTKFEQRAMANLIPFYKWIRLSTPLMADVLLHDPGKAFNFVKALSATSKGLGYDQGEGQGFDPAQADEIVPEYLRKHGAYPMFGGNTHYFDPTSLFPLAGSLDLAGGGISDKVNPLITKPIIALSKYDNSSNLNYALGGNKQSWWQFLSGIVPQTNFAYNEIKPPDPDINRLERLMMMLGNPGFSSNTPKKQKGEIYRDKDAAYHNRREAKKKKGLPATAKIKVH